MNADISWHVMYSTYPIIFYGAIQVLQSKQSSTHTKYMLALRIYIIYLIVYAPNHTIWLALRPTYVSIFRNHIKDRYLSTSCKIALSWQNSPMIKQR